MTGDPLHRGELDPSAYAELRSIAARALAREGREHTLRPTDLVHEAWLRIRGAPLDHAAHAAPLRLYAARTMRQVLVDHARRRFALRRDAARRERLDPRDDVIARRDANLVDLDAALNELASLAPELAAIVELLHFGGSTVEETAREVGISPRTVKRRWRLAKAWLYREVADVDDG